MSGSDTWCLFFNSRSFQYNYMHGILLDGMQDGGRILSVTQGWPLAPPPVQSLASFYPLVDIPSCAAARDGLLTPLIPQAECPGQLLRLLSPLRRPGGVPGPSLLLQAGGGRPPSPPPRPPPFNPLGLYCPS